MLFASSGVDDNGLAYLQGRPGTNVHADDFESPYDDTGQEREIRHSQ